MNKTVIDNYAKLKPSLFILPLFFIMAIIFFLLTNGSFHVDKYVQIQKKYFFLINSSFGQFPNFVYNLTQLGDALLVLSFLTIFLVYAPKIWEALISASLISLLFSSVLKNIFLVPRPAVMFDNSSFIIIGNRAVGFASLPSGHSITVFTTLTVLLFAFMPKKISFKIIWILVTISMGLIIAFTRVGVGAHYPLDVIIGSIVGYFSGLMGIFISRKFAIWTWIGDKKYYPVFILLIIGFIIALISKIVDENLIVFYLALAALLIPFYKLTYAFIKR